MAITFLFAEKECVQNRGSHVWGLEQSRLLGWTTCSTGRAEDTRLSNTGAGRGVNQELEVNIHVLLHRKQTANADLLLSTENSAPCAVTTHVGKEPENEWIPVYKWIPVYV